MDKKLTELIDKDLTGRGFMARSGAAAACSSYRRMRDLYRTTVIAKLP